MLVPQCVIRAVIRIVDLMELDGRLLQLMERGGWSSLRAAPERKAGQWGVRGGGPRQRRVPRWRNTLAGANACEASDKGGCTRGRELTAGS